MNLPQVPYGAVYFRKSNPPREDWERDYATAAADGINCFRHWFLWGAIQVAPNTFDWADYDAQLDLAARHGITTIIAEMVTSAPEWVWRRLPHARYEARDGTHARSSVSASCATGGFPGLCLDNDDARLLAERFLIALVERYRSHPGLGGYDIWNECNISRQYCYCPATRARFRRWLHAKYGELEVLARAWHRYSYATWEDVQPPRDLNNYPEALDWLQFRIDNAYRLMRWRADVIRKLDPNHPVAAHGVAQTLTDHAPSANDEWRAAAEVDRYGFTWIAARRGDEPWKHCHAVDLVRAGCRGKPFWHAEAQAGPLWMQPQVAGRPREDGRIATPEDIRYWTLVSFAGGATGWLCPRWRPLLDGPLFGAFGMYGMDGSRTPRSEMTSRIAKWANAPEQAPLWRARPVRGEVGIVFAPESNHFAYVQQTEWYAEAARGAYQGFFDLHVQPDWVHVDDLLSSDSRPSPYRLLYLPYPVHLRQQTADKLRAWVERGGALVSEGCPGYFGDGGHVGAAQPNLGLDELFGARECYVEFTPDVSDDLTFSVDGQDVPVPGALFLQAYEPNGGAVVGRYAEGYSHASELPAVVDHRFGAGRTRLMGSFPGVGRSRAGEPAGVHGRPSGTMFRTHRAAQLADLPPQERLAGARAFFAGLLEWAGVTPHVHASDQDIIARLHEDTEDGALYLWALNPTREARTVRLEVADRWGTFVGARVHWGVGAPEADGRTVDVTIGARDGAVLRLEPAARYPTRSVPAASAR